MITYSTMYMNEVPDNWYLECSYVCSEKAYPRCSVVKIKEATGGNT